MFDYSGMAAVALSLMQEFGAPATVLRLTSEYNPATGQNASTELVSATIVLQTTVQDFQKTAGAVEVLQGEMVCYLTPTSFMPQANDSLTFPDPITGVLTTWKFQMCQPYQPGNVQLLYLAKLGR